VRAVFFVHDPADRDNDGGVDGQFREPKARRLAPALVLRDGQYEAFGSTRPQTWWRGTRTAGDVFVDRVRDDGAGVGGQFGKPRG
jgi:hypothetical protein